MGAAVYTADQRAGAMHGRQFLLDSVHAGIDNTHVYGRLDFKDSVPEADFDIVVNLESWAPNDSTPRRTLRLDAAVSQRKMQSWKIQGASEEPILASSQRSDEQANAALLRNFEFKLPLAWLLAAPGEALNERKRDSLLAISKLRLRFSLWQNRLPADALPLEGWIELQVLSEGDLLYAVT